MDQIGADELSKRRGQIVLCLFFERESLDRLPRLGMPLFYVVVNVELERVLAKVGLDALRWRLQSHRRIQIAWQVSERDAQVVAVLGVETCVFDEVEAASDNVASSECGSVVLARARAAKRVAIVPVVTVRVLVPAFKVQMRKKMRR